MYHHNKIMSLVLSHHRLSHKSNSASTHSPLSYQVRLEYLVVYRIYSALLNRSTYPGGRMSPQRVVQQLTWTMAQPRPLEEFEWDGSVVSVIVR